MREIKFRAWDKRLNKMYKVLSIKFDEPKWIYCENSLVERFSLKPEELELMQFTGLKDKNGVEIFEGDILKYSYDKFDAYRQETYTVAGISDVKFIRVAFCIQINTWTEGKIWEEIPMFDNSSLDYECIEIIGNIYESKHLLDNNSGK